MSAIAAAETRIYEVRMAWALALRAAKEAEAALAARVRAQEDSFQAWAALFRGAGERLAAAERAKDDADLAWEAALHVKSTTDVELARAASAKRAAEEDLALLLAPVPPENPIQELNVDPADLGGNPDDGPAEGGAAEAEPEPHDELLGDHDWDDLAPDHPVDDGDNAAAQPGADILVVDRPRLPNELVREIFAILQREKKLATLAACVRGCRLFHALGMELLWKDVTLTLDPMAPNGSVRKWRGLLAGTKKNSQWQLVKELDLRGAVHGWQLQPEALKVQLALVRQLRNLEVLKIDARYGQYWPLVERLSGLEVLWITVRDGGSTSWRNASIPQSIKKLHLHDFTGLGDVDNNLKALYRSITAPASLLHVHFAGILAPSFLSQAAVVSKIRSLDLRAADSKDFRSLVLHPGFCPLELKLRRTPYSEYDLSDWSAISKIEGLERLVLDGFTRKFLPADSSLFPRLQVLELILQHRPTDGVDCIAWHCTVLPPPDPEFWRAVGKVQVYWQVLKPDLGVFNTAADRKLMDEQLQRWESERDYWEKVAALTGGRFRDGSR
ncbi:hypothetical protein DFJ74DRAFT_655938 [Hyaloraphidium curvatum]|nr:hypothetical protein DFJ74DRAFT_655938 [Hyaloraphidium curvatum]